MGKTTSKRKMILITLHLTEQQLKALDYLVEKHIFPNRSEAIREAVRRLIDFYSRKNPVEFEFEIGL